MDGWWDLLSTLLPLAQGEAAPDAVPAAPAAPAAPGGLPPMWLLFIPLLLFWVLLIVPERRKKAEINKKLASMKKNDRVVTIGGIHGVIVQTPAESEDVVIRVDETNGTRLRVSRSAIAQIVDSETAETKSAS